MPAVPSRFGCQQCLRDNYTRHKEPMMPVAQHWSLVAALEQRIFAVDVPKCFNMLLGNCLGNEFHNASTCLSNEFHDAFF